MNEITMTTFKHCESVDEHAPHDVEAYDEIAEDEDYSCPGITTLADRVAALERSHERRLELQRDLASAERQVRLLESQVEYHREQHGLKSQALNAATTSPDTKAAYEEGWRSGMERGKAMAAQYGELSKLERTIDQALLPALQHCARLENEVQRANTALNTAYQTINDAFNPAVRLPESDEQTTLTDALAGTVPPAQEGVE